jgi:hypothetical protein
MNKFLHNLLVLFALSFVGPGSVGSVVGSSDPGADGAESGSINLSTGGIVGIAVGIAIVVIAMGKQASHYMNEIESCTTNRSSLQLQCGLSGSSPNADN